MEQSIKLPSGVKFERTDEGFTIISNSGERTEFNNDGTCLLPKAKEIPEWIKHFTLIGKEERRLVASWYHEQLEKNKPKPQKNFLEWIYKALRLIDYDYLIANMEPSMDESGSLYYKEYHPVCVGLTCGEWEEKAKAFSAGYGSSELGDIYELFLWYAYRIASNKWSLEDVCNTSYVLGNYWHAALATHELEPSGMRRVGGAKDGIGNSFKIVKYGTFFALCGGSFEFDSSYYPIADIKYYDNPESYCPYGTGIVVIKNI